MIDARIIEEINHWTPQQSRGFFVEKRRNDEVSAHLDADYRAVNRKIRRPGVPQEGSCNILKRLNPQDIYFSCVDMSSVFSQIELHEDSRDLFTIIFVSGWIFMACR